MAGTILISDGVGTAMSSVSFDFIIEQIRQQFSPTEFELVRSIFTPLDDEGVMFISLEHSSPTDFLAFCRAAAKARLAVEKDSPHWSSNAWSELVDLLSKDPRFSA